MGEMRDKHICIYLFSFISSNLHLLCLKFKQIKLFSLSTIWWSVHSNAFPRWTDTDKKLFAITSLLQGKLIHWCQWFSKYIVLLLVIEWILHFLLKTQCSIFHGLLYIKWPDTHPKHDHSGGSQDPSSVSSPLPGRIRFECVYTLK